MTKWTCDKTTLLKLFTKGRAVTLMKKQLKQCSKVTQCDYSADPWMKPDFNISATSTRSQQLSVYCRAGHPLLTFLLPDYVWHLEKHYTNAFLLKTEKEKLCEQVISRLHSEDLKWNFPRPTGLQYCLSLLTPSDN